PSFTATARYFPAAVARGLHALADSLATRPELTHAEYVTKKERLLVDELGDEQVDELLEHASKLAEERPRRRKEPSWFGAIRSGRGDLSERHEEMLKSELGRSA
ncbi:hypothetical protein, partial [Phytoactinopolyspora endophytica]|uniref:hypothetical protein n=1 Tax=Phytoactinopolyspora endophytica TaxID=1642495 RepID=UPI00197B76B2